MTREQQRALRRALGKPTVSLPFTLAFWVLYFALMYRLTWGW